MLPGEMVSATSKSKRIFKKYSLQKSEYKNNSTNIFTVISCLFNASYWIDISYFSGKNWHTALVANTDQITSHFCLDGTIGDTVAITHKCGS